MKNEESPDISKRSKERDMKVLQQISCTPKGKKIGLDDLHLLGLHRDCSPNAYGSSQDGWEIGWGDSPEPLKMDHKSKFLSTPVACKKRLDSRESPKSTCRNIRPSIRPPSKPPSKPPVDVSKYIAEVQELSKRIMNEIENDKLSGSDKRDNASVQSSGRDVSDYAEEKNNLTNEWPNSCPTSSGNKPGKWNENPSDKRVEKENKALSGSDSSKEPSSSSDNSKDANDHLTSNYDSAFEKVLQSFINEEDDWLAQVVLNTETKITPRKNGFVKTKSENQLSSPDRTFKINNPVARRSSGLTSAFRRTYSSERVESSNFSKINSDSVGSSNSNSNASGTGRVTVRRTNFLSGRSQSSQRKIWR